MFEERIVLDSAEFNLRHLTDSADDRQRIATFSAGKNALGLERYLKDCSVGHELAGENRTYLVLDAITEELACYFTLRSGLIPVPENTREGYLSTLSGMELAYFAVNENYRRSKTKTTNTRIGFYVFDKFILPIAKHVSRIIGARILFVYALPHPKLMSYYANTLGFRTLPRELERFLYDRVKPDSDEGCVFMFQPL